jgi:hypothetical protein
MTIRESARRVGRGLNNQQNQWTTKLKQAAPPCGWKGKTMKKVARMQIRLPAAIGVRGMDIQAAAMVGEGPLGCVVGERL